MEVEVCPVRDNPDLDAVSLLLREELQGVRCPLSPCPRVLAAPEWHLEGPDQPAVGPDGADLQVPGHPVNDPNVLRPDTGTQSVPEIWDLA